MTRTETWDRICALVEQEITGVGVQSSSEGIDHMHGPAIGAPSSQAALEVAIDAAAALAGLTLSRENSVEIGKLAAAWMVGVSIGVRAANDG